MWETCAQSILLAHDSILESIHLLLHPNHMALVAINYNKCYNLIYYVEYLKKIELFFRSPNRLKNADANYQFQIVLIIYRVVIVKVRWQIRCFTALAPLAALLLLRWEFIKENK